MALIYKRRIEPRLKYGRPASIYITFDDKLNLCQRENINQSNAHRPVLSR